MKFKVITAILSGLTADPPDNIVWLDELYVDSTSDVEAWRDAIKIAQAQPENDPEIKPYIEIWKVEKV